MQALSFFNYHLSVSHSSLSFRMHHYQNLYLLKTINAFKCSEFFFYHFSDTSGLYYKPMTIVNDNSKVVNRRETSLTDDARVIIYDCHMFIVRVRGGSMRHILLFL